MMELKGSLILKLAIITEGLLLACSLIWAWFFPPDRPVVINTQVLIHGVYATGPLLAFNFGVFIVLARNPKYQIYRKFLEYAVFPLCGALNWWLAIPVALLAGFGEEIFFRLMLYPAIESSLGPLLAAVISSFLFAYMHFIGRAKDFIAIVLLYFLFGLYFCYLSHFHAGVGVAIIAHALYDYIVILFVRYVEIPHHPLLRD